jgi:hypothetical protein
LIFKLLKLKFPNLNAMQQRLVEKGFNYVMFEAEMAVLHQPVVDLDPVEDHAILLLPPPPPPPPLLPIEAERAIRLL